MIINNIQYNASLEEIFTELQSQLHLNGIQYFNKGYKPTGDHIMVQCPYHGDGQEKKPSAGIRMSDGVLHCFACNEVHSLPEVISYCFGYSDDIFGKEGVKWLTKNFATVQIENRKDIELDFGRTKEEQKIEYVSEKELKEYRWIHPYMYSRKLTDDVIDLFDVGYDAKTKCITFPVRDIDGNCLFVARRSVKTKFFSYPKGVEKPLYGIYELYQQRDFPSEVIICESMIDALTFWVIGRCAAALNGLGTPLQFRQLEKLPCRKLILCTDSDKAGMEARRRIHENVKGKIITEYILPQGRKDANECNLDELKNLEQVFG